MTKNFFTSMLMLMMVFMGVVTMSSCGSDDDDEENGIETPTNAANAMKLTISDTQSPYSSIEFTESGNYIITKAGSSSYSKRFLTLSVSVTRSSVDDSYLTGTYTKSGDTYTLSDFGTVTVAKKGTTDASITVKKTGAEAKTYGAKVTTSISTSDMTKKLCRTWGFESIEYKEMRNDKVVYTFNGSYLDYMKQNNDEDEKFCVEVTFTAAGSYILKYEDNSIEVAQWKWSDEKNGKLIYSFDGEDWDNDDVTTISFSGSKMYITSDFTETDEDRGITYSDHGTITLVQK